MSQSEQMPAAETSASARLRLRLRGKPAFCVDASALSPDRLAGLPQQALAHVHLRLGARTVELGSLFDIEIEEHRDPSADAQLVLEGSRAGLARLDRIGRGMQRGSIVVHGDAGHYVGLDMRGGSIHVRGSCGDFLACGMRGGSIRVDRHAGDGVASVLPGSNYGMRGGIVLVRGNVGSRCGERMRRGLVLIEGDAADMCAHRMVAGTIVVGGDPGAHPGMNLLHGSLIVSREPRALPSTFGDSGSHTFAFMRMLADEVRPHSSRLAALLRRNGHVRRLTGDLAVGGRGEILVIGAAGRAARGKDGTRISEPSHTTPSGNDTEKRK